MVLPIIFEENVRKMGKNWKFRVDLIRQRRYSKTTN